MQNVAVRTGITSNVYSRLLQYAHGFWEMRRGEDSEEALVVKIKFARLMFTSVKNACLRLSRCHSMPHRESRRYQR